MKTLKEAIEIFENYLHYNYNVDPLYDNQYGASRIYYTETKYYWQLVHCKKENINSKIIDQLIGGAYIVDKTDGNIYMIGSSPLIEWEKEFEKFKLNKNSQINWDEKINYYLNCERIKYKLFEFQSDIITCHLDNRDIEIENAIRENFKNGIETCTIHYKPFESEEGTIKINCKIKEKEETINVISIPFKDQITNSSNYLLHLKKYLRVNNLQQTDNYWIEIKMSNISNDFSEWNFEYKMEYIIK